MVFGRTIVNSDGITVNVRDIGEQHVLEDMGTIPSVDNWLSNMTLQDWMGGTDKKKKVLEISLVD